MPRKSFASALGAALIGLGIGLPSVAASAIPVEPGAANQTSAVWINPRGSVKVATSGCGNRLCGWVVWASPEALQDAREGGVQNLVGTQLLRDFRQTGRDLWQGRLFVPDMGRTFYSTITRLDPQALKISGCILGGLICKAQVWHRA
jgi:uncharacterized protein (DUF2147 family)